MPRRPHDHNVRSPEPFDGDQFQKVSRTYRAEIEIAAKGKHRCQSSKSRDAERSFRKKSGKDSPAWGVVLSGILLLVGLIVAAVVSLNSAATPTAGTPSVEEKITIVDAALPSTAQHTWTGLTPQAVAENFLNAKTDAERLAWVRDPDQVADLLRQFYQAEARTQERFTKVSEIPQNLASAKATGRFVANFSNGGKRLVSIRYDESGAGKVDFKCFSRYCSESWENLLAGRVSKAAEMRCLLEVNAYYNFQFADESAWLCLSATSPDFEDVIYLYAKRDDPALAGFIRNPPTVLSRFTVGLEAIDQSHKRRQFRITQLVSPSWDTP